MKFAIYKNKLGKEEYLTTIDENIAPVTGSLICIKTGEKECDNEVYVVKQCLYDYSQKDFEYCVFVKPYDWED